MITFISKNFNTFDQKNNRIQSLYDNFIHRDVDFSIVTCSCGHDHCLTRHAYYTRTVKTMFGSFRIRILRVKCSLCNVTHAVMISCIIPYSQILLKQQMEIVTHSLSSLDNLMIQYTIDEAHIRYIKKQYHTYWKSRLCHLTRIFHDQLSWYCFHHFKKQFMQIRFLSNVPIFMDGSPYNFNTS